MRSTIRRILREMASTNLRKELISRGPKKAQESFGMSLEDYVNIVYNGNIIEYVANNIPELTDLKKHSIYSYDYNGRGPLQGLVFRYRGKHTYRNGNIVLPYASIPESKITYLIALEKLLTPELLIKFINEFYDLDVTRIAKIPSTNFGSST